MAIPALQVSTVAEAIQLAVAPVFLLSGAGIILTVLTNRLARVVERARGLEAASAAADSPSREQELDILVRRARLMNRSITLCTVCALLVSFVVVTLFVDTFVAFDLSPLIAILFVTSMLSLIVALLSFLREVFLAIGALRISIRRK
jgi:hypothetical protein